VVDEAMHQSESTNAWNGSEIELEVRETKRELASERADRLRCAPSVAQMGSMQPLVCAVAGGLLTIFFCVHGWLQLGFCLHSFGHMGLGDSGHGFWTFLHHMADLAPKETKVVVISAFPFLLHQFTVFAEFIR
jgi:hypothetical protein